jgi:GT2 family glycosyltransferase
LSRADLITVYHNDAYRDLYLRLRDDLKRAEPDGGYRYLGVDNRRDNRGFAAACNVGAFHVAAISPIVGFLNPDVTVEGPFIDAVTAALTDNTVITGCRFGKPANELRAWGVTEWVCGAAMFVKRDFFVSVGGFDVQFTWSWEETDLIRQAESRGYKCQPLNLPIRHDQSYNDPADSNYKRYHFAQGERRYRAKWGTR